MLTSAKFAKLNSVTLPGGHVELPIPPKDLVTMHIARLLASAGGFGPANEASEMNVYGILAGRKWPGKPRQIGLPITVGTDQSNLEQIAELAMQLNSRRYAIDIEPWLMPPGMNLGTILKDPAGNSQFFTLDVRWNPDCEAESGLLTSGKLLKAPLLPHFGLRLGKHFPMRLIYLLDEPSNDFAARGKLQAELAHYFDSTPGDAAGLPEPMPLAGTVVFDHQGNAVSRVELWESGLTQLYSLSQLMKVFGARTVALNSLRG